MSLMLSSVRDTGEAALALDLGSDWIDVKEPRHGALGGVAPGDLRAIVSFVAGRLPVSATIGDCWDRPREIGSRVRVAAASGVDFVKVGLDPGDRAQPGVDALRDCASAGIRLIAVCAAERPPEPRFLDALAACGVEGVMLDTMDKTGPRLAELLTPAQLVAFTRRGRSLGLLTGLAGRLEPGDLPVLGACGADYLGFRSALCAAGKREEGIDTQAFAHVRAAMSALGRTGTEQHSEVA